ncbi:MAG: hypothetical protein KIT79_12170 [Deltaproteobacteria bacterium]|nr:hypothetical protein [Deltaproteobacteria bacterium]
MRRISRVPLWLGLAFLLSFPSGSFAQAGGADIVEKFEHGEINWTKMTVRAWGEGLPNPKHLNPAQARIGAERAAQVDATRRLLEMAKGVRVTSEATMRDYALLNDRIMVTLEGVVKGAMRVDTAYHNDRVVVTMEMPLTGEMLAVLQREAGRHLRRPPSGLKVDEFESRLPSGAARDAYERTLDRLRRDSAEYQARKDAEAAEIRARQEAALKAQKEAEEKARQLRIEEERLKSEADKARQDAEVKKVAEAERKAAEQKAKEAEYQREQQRIKAEEEQRRAADAARQRELLDQEMKERALEEERRVAEIKRLEADALKAPAAAPAVPPAGGSTGPDGAVAAGAAAGGAVAGAAVAGLATTATTADSKPVDSSSDVQWSGLVVDARGLGLKPALVPRIYSDTGSDVYSTQVVEVENATRSGLVGYARDVGAASRHIRVASDPVLVKGVQAAGTQKSDLVVSGGDAKVVSATDRKNPYLKNARVMVVFN